jgi:uncharacterized protein (DUF1697 family)
MPKLLVLLRGVNVGKGNRVPMAEFKQALEGLGYTGVRTLLNSGNAVFTSAGGSVRKHEQDIAAAVQAKFGVSAPVVVKSAGEFAAIVHGNPMPPQQADHSRFLVAFASSGSALQALHPLSVLAQPQERLVITPQAAYLHCPGGLLESKIGSALLGKPGQAVTSRNWATVLKLAALIV